MQVSFKFKMKFDVFFFVVSMAGDI